MRRVKAPEAGLLQMLRAGGGGGAFVVALVDCGDAVEVRVAGLCGEVAVGWAGQRRRIQQLEGRPGLALAGRGIGAVDVVAEQVGLGLGSQERSMEGGWPKPPPGMAASPVGAVGGMVSWKTTVRAGEGSPRRSNDWTVGWVEGLPGAWRGPRRASGSSSRSWRPAARRAPEAAR